MTDHPVRRQSVKEMQAEVRARQKHRDRMLERHGPDHRLTRRAEMALEHAVAQEKALDETRDWRNNLDFKELDRKAKHRIMRHFPIPPQMTEWHHDPRAVAMYKELSQQHPGMDHDEFEPMFFAAFAAKHPRRAERYGVPAPATR